MDGTSRSGGTPPIPDPFAIRSRPARASERQPAADDPNDPAAWSELAEEWAEPGAGEWDELSTAVPERRPTPSRRRVRETGRESSRETSRESGRESSRQFVRGRTRPRPAIDLSAARMPAFMGRSDLLGDRVSGILIGANLLSLVVMAVRLATQISQLPAALPVHLDAAGLVDGWGTPGVLWRLPLIAGMTLLMNLVVAWFVAPIDRFAARFVLAAALGVQLIVWIALLDFV